MDAQNQELNSDICVVGAGLLGLLALKNLREQGLNATAFERQEYVGGTWHASNNIEQTTALEYTTANTSKQCCSITDFPMPDDFPVHPPQKDLERYFESYTEKFGLYPHIRFSVSVYHIERDEPRKAWRVFLKDVKTGVEEIRTFGRVVVATGMLNTRHLPHVKGLEKFSGDAIHSRQFKDASKYQSKNVVVVGIGATGVDSTSFLVKAGTNKVYLSHRGTVFVLPRRVKGKAFEHTLSRRVSICLRTIGNIMPNIFAGLMTKMMINMRDKEWPHLKEVFGTRPVDGVLHGVLHRVPLFSEHLADNLKDGTCLHSARNTLLAAYTLRLQPDFIALPKIPDSVFYSRRIMSDPTPNGDHLPHPPAMSQAEFDNAIKEACKVAVHDALSGLEEHISNAVATQVTAELKKVMRAPLEN
ncbi:hypothetical protein H9Q70_003623 [Fusarium xylarioides]|nr:hypothetical protein H9Q70_003623 [Fusarium xylarioides]KAG5784619.1 hypothetical protein H9Q73_001762 [Fusarium xylarioides]